MWSVDWVRCVNKWTYHGDEKTAGQFRDQEVDKRTLIRCRGIHFIICSRQIYHRIIMVQSWTEIVSRYFENEQKCEKCNRLLEFIQSNRSWECHFTNDMGWPSSVMWKVPKATNAWLPNEVAVKADICIIIEKSTFIFCKALHASEYNGTNVICKYGTEL